VSQSDNLRKTRKRVVCSRSSVVTEPAFDPRWGPVFNAVVELLEEDLCEALGYTTDLDPTRRR
jgi:hypothetical protein